MSSEFSSRISGFYKKPVEERISIITEKVGLTPEEVETLKSRGGLTMEAADRMTENVIGTIAYPFSVAVNFRVDGRDYLIPMAGEEPSVVAAASNMARLMRDGPGIEAEATDPVMIGQIQVLDVPDMDAAVKAIEDNKETLIESANELDPVLVRFGGGAKDIVLRPIETEDGPMLIVHLLVDCRDAMGANAVNTMAEALAPTIAELAGGRTLLRIISNLADRRLITVKGKVKKEDIGGEKAVDNIVSAWAFADADPYRAATHNKGIMNDVDAVVIATGNDWRAVEAGAHAYAVKDGQYTSLSTWGQDDQGNLVGALEMPMAVGIVGGATKVHPTARAALKLMGVKTAAELAEIIVSVGLAQNLAALRALATEGIQRGHMSLHARQVAIAAGAQGEMITRLAEQLVSEKIVRIDRAEEILNQWNSAE